MFKNVSLLFYFKMNEYIFKVFIAFIPKVLLFILFNVKEVCAKACISYKCCSQFKKCKLKSVHFSTVYNRFLKKNRLKRKEIYIEYKTFITYMQ